MFYIIYRLPHTLVWGEDHHGQPPRNMWHRVIHYNVSDITYSHATVVAGATCYEDEPPTPSDHSDVVLQTSQHHCRTDVGWSEEDVAELKLGRTCTFMYVMLYIHHIYVYTCSLTPHTYIHTYIHTHIQYYIEAQVHMMIKRWVPMFIHTICCQCKYHRKCMQGKNVWASQRTCGHTPYLRTHQTEPSLSWCSWHSLAVQRSPSAWSSHSYLWGVEGPWMILATGQQRGEVMWYGRKQIIDHKTTHLSWSPGVSSWECAPHVEWRQLCCSSWHGGWRELQEENGVGSDEGKEEHTEENASRFHSLK